MAKRMRSEARPSSARKLHLRRLALEGLEARTLLSTLPSPMTHGQAVVGLSRSGLGNSSSPSVAVDPLNPNQLVAAGTTSTASLTTTFSVTSPTAPLNGTYSLVVANANLGRGDFAIRLAPDVFPTTVGLDPTLPAPGGSLTGTVNGIPKTNLVHPFISGTSEISNFGNVVTITLSDAANGLVIGTGTTDAFGHFSVQVGDLSHDPSFAADGVKTVGVQATDSSGAKGNVTFFTYVLETTVQPAPQVVAPTVQNLQRFGFHAQPTKFVLTFSTALDPAAAQDVANYRLNAVIGHRIGRAIRIKAAVYDPTTHAVTLQPAQRLYLFGRYLLEVNGSTPTGVAGATGLLLDGRGNGMPGTDYVATFGKEILAGPNDPPRISRRSLRHQHLPPMTDASSHQPTGSTATSRNQALSAPAVDAVLAELVKKRRHER